MNIRLLKANEIEARVQTVKENGCSILLYKDARCDMKILDETFGMMGWQRKHNVVNGNLFCTVSIYNSDTKQWIDKEDVGIESNTAKEKGQASDSFKRACFNIGIGRELYTSPFVWVKLNKEDVKEYKGKFQVNRKFEVKEIAYNDDREINRLVIVDEKGKVRYELGKQIKQEAKAEAKKEVKQIITQDQITRLYTISTKKGFTEQQVKEVIKKSYNKESTKELTKKEYDEIVKRMEAKEDAK